MHDLYNRPAAICLCLSSELSASKNTGINDLYFGVGKWHGLLANMYRVEFSRRRKSHVGVGLMTAMMRLLAKTILIT